MRFKITPDHAQAWLECMSEAMDEVGLEGPFREQYFQRLVLTAHHMIMHLPGPGNLFLADDDVFRLGTRRRRHCIPSTC